MNKALGMGAALVALTLAGCGQKSAQQTGSNAAAGATSAAAAQAASTPFDPCSVLTTDEVTAITTDKVSKTSANGPDCHYQTTFDEDGTTITIHRKGGAEEMDDLRQAYKALGGIGAAAGAQGAVGKDVQGAITPPAAGATPAIGDDVLWGPNDVLAVRKGELFVQVTPPVVHAPAKMIGDTEKRAIAQKLAVAVLAKLAK